ncbi:hypothetical protein EOD39_7987 [Acipenser ruthenus]|uniref:Uncharacterized protein n=1 Tax=Acipenser ruthenus TaxID=7906 RepID=A0A662YWX3_ACIRT|nr:hypothetical protein EOD39_7987 [Acipenser ruthenus]
MDRAKHGKCAEVGVCRSRIAFTRAQCKRVSHDTAVKSSNYIPGLTSEERQELYKRLYESEKQESQARRSAILSIVPGYAAKCVPCTVQLNLPDSLNKLYSPDNINCSYNELLERSEVLFDELVVTEVQGDFIRLEFSNLMDPEKNQN